MIIDDYRIIRIRDGAELSISNLATIDNNQFSFYRNVSSVITGPTSFLHFSDDMIQEDIDLTFINKEDDIKNFFHVQGDIYKIKITGQNGSNPTTFNSLVFTNKTTRNLHHQGYNRFQLTVTRFSKWYKEKLIFYNLLEGEIVGRGYPLEYPIAYPDDTAFGTYEEGVIDFRNEGSIPGTLDIRIKGKSETPRLEIGGEFFQSTTSFSITDYLHILNGPFEFGIFSNVDSAGDKRNKDGKTFLTVPIGESQMVVNRVTKMEVIFYEYYDDIFWSN